MSNEKGSPGGRTARSLPPRKKHRRIRLTTVVAVFIFIYIAAQFIRFLKNEKFSYVVAKNLSLIHISLLGDCFPEGYVAVVQGGREENQTLLEQRFDYIFFTGGTEVGKVVLEKAARYVTPVTLELGGKSPCIVDRTADIKRAAKRIVFGKFLNCGQTCVCLLYTSRCV